MNEFDYKGWVNGSIGGEVPTEATSDGDKGQITFDENYIYVCVDDNTWKRVKLSSF